MDVHQLLGQSLNLSLAQSRHYHLVGYFCKSKIKMYISGSGCLAHDIIQHEMLHALGFHHEQMRPDAEVGFQILSLIQFLK